MEKQCISKFKYQDQCTVSDKLSQNQRRDRIQSIMNAYGDDLSKTLDTELNKKPDLTISYHINCVSGYTSSSSLKNYKLSSNYDADPPTLNPYDYGWMKDPVSLMGSLEPITAFC